MWLLNFLPNWVVHICLIAGLLGLAASYILTFIPFVSLYKTPIQAAAIIVLVVSVFLEGAISNNDAWQLKVAEAEKRALVAEAKSAEQNVKIVTKFVEKTKAVEENKILVQKQIDKNAATVDSYCFVIPEVINILNQAASSPGVKK